MAAPQLTAAPDPVDEPIVLVIDGVTYLTQPSDPAWPIAFYAREREQAVQACERDLRSKRALITELRKRREDEDQKARDNRADREAIMRIFDRWRLESGRKRCKLTPERFDMTAARFDEDYDEAVLTMAAVGIALNAYVIEGERKGDFETAFKSGGRVERYANRCPPELRREIRATVGESQLALMP